jgi:hypothetical protein
MIDVINTIPVQSSQSADWVEWHKALKKRFGKLQANQLWLKAWGFRGTSKSNTGELRSYMKDNGVILDTNILGKAKDIQNNIFDTVADTLKVSSGLAIGIIAISVIGVGFIVYKIVSPSDNLTRVVVAGTSLKKM